MWLIGAILVLANCAAAYSEGLATASHILPRRSLLQSVAPLTIVTTAHQLDAAIRNGDTRIEIQSHLDFSSWVLPRTLHSTASITGNCDSPPPAGTTLPLGTLVTGRCVVVVSSSFARVTGALWLNGLHLILVEQPYDEGSRLELCADGLTVCEIKREGTGDSALLEVTGSQARLWVTNVAVQGTTSGTGSNGHPNQAYRYLASALEVASGGRVFMEDSVISDFETVRTVSMSGGGMTSFKRVAFNSNTLVPSSRGSGIVLVTVTDGQGAAQISLDQVTYSGNSEDYPELVADANVTYYGDANAPLMCTYPPFDDAEDYSLVCQLSRSLPLEQAGAAAGFLTATHEWFVRAEQGTPLPSDVPELENPSSGRKDTKWDKNFIIFVATTCFVSLLIVKASVLCCVWPWWSCSRYQFNTKPLTCMNVRSLFKKNTTDEEETNSRGAEDAGAVHADASKAPAVEEAPKAVKSSKKIKAERKREQKAAKDAEGIQVPEMSAASLWVGDSMLDERKSQVSSVLDMQPPSVLPPAFR